MAERRRRPEPPALWIRPRAAGWRAVVGVPVGRDAGQQALDLGGGVRRGGVAHGVLAADREQPLAAEAEDRQHEARDLEPVAAGQPVDGGDRLQVERRREQHDLGRVAGHGGGQRLVDAGERRGVHGGDRGRAGERLAQLRVGDLGGDADDDGAAGLLVEREHLEPGRLALDHEAEGRLAELAGEGLP